MTPRRAAAVIAGLVLALGIILAAMPLSTGILADDVKCGSALQPHYATADIKDILDDRPSSGGYLAMCEDAVSNRRIVAYPLVGGGALVLLFVRLTIPTPPPSGRRRQRLGVEVDGL